MNKLLRTITIHILILCPMYGIFISYDFSLLWNAIFNLNFLLFNDKSQKYIINCKKYPTNGYRDYANIEPSIFKIFLNFEDLIK